MLRSITIILILFTASCSWENNIVESQEIKEEDVTIKELFLSEQTDYNTNHREFYFISFTTLKDGSLIVFDKNEGQLIKFDEQGNIVETTGGIGEGPDEFVVDVYANVLYCGGDKVIAYDWNLPRFHTYDKNLNYLKTISLNGVPYEATCYDKDTIAILYSTKQEAEILDIDGNVKKSLKFDSEPFNELSMFKHIKFKNNLWFIAYYFQPKFKRFENNKGLSHLVKLPSQYSESVKTAVRSISTIDNSVHLFYNDINSPKPKNKRKITHVFSDAGSYKFSYQIPAKINYYEVISENSLIAIEDSMESITLYNFTIDD